jgi:S1-C subfamily serine protease
MGYLYDPLNDNGIEKNPTEALKWYQKAAEQSNNLAQFQLGVMFDIGDGVAKDYTEAAKWYRKAAEQGNDSAQCDLAEMLESGRGVETNQTEAVDWYQRSAEQGNHIAQFDLGCVYAAGKIAPKNPVLAVKLFQQSAAQGFMPAQKYLGMMYFNGLGVIQDYAEAYKWYSIAAVQGDEDSAKKRDAIAVTLLTPSQIAEGKRQAKEFFPNPSTPDSIPSFTTPANPSYTATGFFITDDGYLISNYHVVKDAVKVQLVTRTGTIDARVVQTDAANDLALLKADGQFAALPIVPSRKIALGNLVTTVGFPDPSLQGFSPKLARGEIAALAGAVDDARYFQISLPVQPGNSGGALVDEHGNVVGIVSAKLDAAAALAASGSLPENVNYAIKSSFLLSFLESVPDVANKLKDPSTADRKFEDIVKSAQEATVMVLVK